MRDEKTILSLIDFTAHDEEEAYAEAVDRL